MWSLQVRKSQSRLCARLGDESEMRTHCLDIFGGLQRELDGSGGLAGLVVQS